jgi:hypothetical protein
MKYRRKLFLANKTKTSDKDFLNHLGIASSPSSQVAIALRNAMAIICSVEPEMLSPDDSPRTLCSIMDWGMPNWGWLIGAADYASFSDRIGFSVLFENEYRKLTNELPHISQNYDWADYLPDFAGYSIPNCWVGKEAETLGEWIKQAIEIILESNEVVK